MPQPFARGTATKRDDPPLLTRIRTLFLLSVRAASMASRTSLTLATLFPATSRITSPSLKPRSAAALCGSTSVTTTPSLPAPATELAGASVKPSFGTSVPRFTPPLSPLLLSVSALASTEFGNWPSVRSTTLSWPLCSTLSFTALPGRRTVGLGLRHQPPFRLLQPEAVGDVSRDRLNLNADPAAADRALVLELGDHVLHGGSGNREGDADAAAGRRIDRGIDAHHLAFGVEGRAAGVALVHGRVDLDEIVIRAVADVAAAGRDDAGRDSAAEAEGIADREHPITDPGLAIRKLGKREVRAALDLDQGEVGTRIGADHLGLVDLAVVGGHFDLVGAVDHVVVGDGIPVSGNEEAGTLAGHGVAAARSATHPWRQTVWSAEATEEALHRRARLEWRIIVVAAIVLRRDLLVDIDLHRDHRRLYALDDVGKADRLLDLAGVVFDLRMRRARENINRPMRRAKTVDGDAETGDDRSHQRKFACRKQRTARCLVRGEGRKIVGTFGHSVISKSLKIDGAGSSTFHVGRWGFSPYRALARELNFCNKGASECGSLSQGENGPLRGAKTSPFRAKRRLSQGLSRPVRRGFRCH